MFVGVVVSNFEKVHRAVIAEKEEQKRKNKEKLALYIGETGYHKFQLRGRMFKFLQRKSPYRKRRRSSSFFIGTPSERSKSIVSTTPVTTPNRRTGISMSQSQADIGKLSINIFFDPGSGPDQD